MTATNEAQVIDQVKLPPRPFIRTVWSLHKAAYRLTGGRFGLQQPDRGAKFGMLRLHTVGRRSGKGRIAMIGYYEHGKALVTLAMNGWGDTDPAWWLNLKANPTATVDMATGTRTVIAREATGTERERLWATFRDYPGWGDDLGALAGRRPGQTAIVVLEPIESVGPTSATRDQLERAVRAVTPAVAEKPGRRLRRRHLWLVPGLAIAIYANAVGNAYGVSILELIAFGIAPDVPRLFGRRGRPIHNLLHQPIGPIIAVAITLSGIVPTFWLVGSLVWLGHVIAGQGVGDVPHGAGERPNA